MMRIFQIEFECAAAAAAAAAAPARYVFFVLCTCAHRATVRVHT